MRSISPSLGLDRRCSRYLNKQFFDYRILGCIPLAVGRTLEARSLPGSFLWPLNKSVCYLFCDILDEDSRSNWLLYKYKLAAKCSKKWCTAKTHLYSLCVNLISPTFLSHRFSDWFGPLLYYLLVSSINIFDIWKTGTKHNPFQLLIFKNQNLRLGTSK